MGSQLYGRLAMAEDWRGDLEIWLAPFLAALRHKTRVRLCPAYIAGLIGPGDRKSGGCIPFTYVISGCI